MDFLGDRSDCVFESAEMKIEVFESSERKPESFELMLKLLEQMLVFQQSLNQFLDN